jgi:hypothetical protein
MLVDELLEVHASHELHHHEILAAHLSEMVGLDDVGVDEIGHEPRFTDEVPLKLLNRRIFLANQLYGDDLSEAPCAELFRLVNDAHATIGHLANHFIMNFAENVFDGRHDVLEKTARSGFWQVFNLKSARKLLQSGMAAFDSRDLRSSFGI